MVDPAMGGTLATTRAGSRPIGGGKDSNGEIRLNEERAVYLSPVAPGVVRSILVDVGARVQAGEVLFEVESSEYRQAKADLLRAKAALTLAEATAERERDLYEKGVCPRKDVLEAEAALAQAPPRSAYRAGWPLVSGQDRRLLTGAPRSLAMPVRAPFDGTVLERSLSLGAQAQPGDKLLLLADTAKVWVITTVYEREVAALLQAQRLAPVQAAVTVQLIRMRRSRAWSRWRHPRPGNPNRQGGSSSTTQQPFLRDIRQVSSCPVLRWPGSSWGAVLRRGPFICFRARAGSLLRSPAGDAGTHP
jgi:multidrug efflux pump subunit AcrA (membrane-fusion protein)